jgi:RNA polymerase primary sigma factor
MRQLKISQTITTRESQSLEKYFQDVNKIEMITAEEEAELSIRIQEGDQIALDKMVRANLRFVVSVAKQYQNRNLTLNDLINEGNIGLIRGAEKFDHTRGFKFISYAVWWIRQSIMQAIAENSRMVRMPLNRVSTLNRIKRAAAEMQQGLHREPTNEELAEMMEMDAKEVKKTLEGNMRQLSMDAPFSSAEDGSLLDVLKDNNVDDTDRAVDYMDSLAYEANRSLDTLKPKDSNILKMFFGIGCDNAMSLEQISDELGLTRERVRQLKEKSLRELRGVGRADRLAEFLG